MIDFNRPFEYNHIFEDISASTPITIVLYPGDYCIKWGDETTEYFNVPLTKYTTYSTSSGSSLYITKFEPVTFSADNGSVTESVTETIDCGNLGTPGTVEVETQLYAWVGGLLNTLSPTPNVGDRAYNIDGTITDRTVQSCDGTNIVFVQDGSGGTISGTRSADADSVVLVEKEGLIPATIDYYEDNRFISESNRPSGRQLYPVEGTNEDQGLLTDSEITNVDNGVISDYWYNGYNDDNGEIDG